MKATGYIAVPNWIINDHTMYDSTKKVLIAMLAYSDRNHAFRKSQAELSNIVGYCRSTIIQAISQLSEKGFLNVTPKYYFSKRLNKMVYGKSMYQLYRCSTHKHSYTLIPRILLEQPLTPAEFTISLHIYRLSGRKGRCFPSLRRLAKVCDHSKATICSAVKRIWSFQIVAKLHCQKEDTGFSCNSYYPTDFVIKRNKQDLFSVLGGLKFRQQPVIKKITKGFTWLKTKNVAHQSPIPITTKTPDPIYRFGSGILVSVTEEPFL